MFKKLKKSIKKLIHGDENNGRIKWSLYGRVWREIGKPQWKWLVAGVITTVLAAGAEAYTITLVQQVVDNAFIQKSMTHIYLFGLQIIAAFGFKGAFNYAKSLIMSKAGLNASADLQKKIYRHMVKMNISKFLFFGPGGRGIKPCDGHVNQHSPANRNTDYDIGINGVLCTTNVRGVAVPGAGNHDSNGVDYAQTPQIITRIFWHCERRVPTFKPNPAWN